jgi:hypothetical protein
MDKRKVNIEIQRAARHAVIAIDPITKLLVGPTSVRTLPDSETKRPLVGILADPALVTRCVGATDDFGHFVNYR